LAPPFGPGAQRFADLRQRQRNAHDVGGLLRDDRGRGVHVDHQFFGFVGNAGRAERFRGQREAGQDVDAVTHHQFLRQTLGDIRVRAAGVLPDDLDLLAGDAVTVLLHVELDAVIDLRRGVGELAGVGADDADFDRTLGLGTSRQQASRKRGGKQDAFHWYPPRLYRWP
jgi:hypothetical protein